MVDFKDYMKQREGSKLHTRYYVEVDGKKRRVPGVTTVLDNIGWNKRTLMAWQRKKMDAGEDPDAHRDTAALLGTLAHKMIEYWYRGEEPDLSAYPTDLIPLAEGAFRNFVDIALAMKFAGTEMETVVVSNEHRYGGSIDLLGYRNETARILADFKTTENVYPEHKIQLAAYKRAYEETHDDKIDEAWLFCIGKERGTCAAHQLTEDDLQYGDEAFLAARTLHELHNRMNRKG